MSTRPRSGKENGFRSESGQKQTFFVLAQKVRFRGQSGHQEGDDSQSEGGLGPQIRNSSSRAVFFTIWGHFKARTGTSRGAGGSGA